MCSDASLLALSLVTLAALWLAIAAAIGRAWLIAAARDRRLAGEELTAAAALRRATAQRDAASRRRELVSVQVLAYFIARVRR